MKDQTIHQLPEPRSAVTLKAALPFRSFHTIIGYGNGFLASDEFNHKLIYFDLRGTVITLSDKLKLKVALSYPRGMSVIDGAVWLCDSWNNRIVVFDVIPEDASAIPVRIIEYPFFDEPSDLCQTGERIIVANKGNDTICTLKMSGEAEWTFPVETIPAGANPPRPFPPSVADSLGKDEGKVEFRRPCQVLLSPHGLAVVDRKHCRILANASRIEHGRSLPAGLYERNALCIDSTPILLDDAAGSLLALNDVGEPFIMRSDSPIEACWIAGDTLFCAQMGNQLAEYSLDSIRELLNEIDAKDASPKSSPTLNETLEVCLRKDITSPEIAKHKNIIKADDELRSMLFENLLKLGRQQFERISKSMDAVASSDVVNDLVNLDKSPDPMPFFNANLIIAENTNYSDEANKQIRTILDAAESVGLMHWMISLFLECEETTALSERLAAAAMKLHRNTAQELQELYDSIASVFSDSGDLAQASRQHRTFVLQYGLYIQIRKFALTSIMFHDHIREDSAFSSEEKKYEGSYLSPPAWRTVAQHTDDFGNFCDRVKRCTALYEHYKESPHPTKDETQALIHEQWRLSLHCHQISDDKFFVPAPLIANEKALQPLFEANGETFDDEKPAPWKNSDEALLLGIISDDTKTHETAQEAFIEQYVAQPNGCCDLIKRLWIYEPIIAFDFAETLRERLATNPEHGWRSAIFADFYNQMAVLKEFTLKREFRQEDRDALFAVFTQQYYQNSLHKAAAHYSGSMTFIDEDTSLPIITEKTALSGEFFDALDALDSEVDLAPGEILKWQLASSQRDFEEFSLLWRRQLARAVSKTPAEILQMLQSIIVLAGREIVEKWLDQLFEFHCFSPSFAQSRILAFNTFREKEKASREWDRLEKINGESASSIFQKLLINSSLSANERKILTNKLNHQIHSGVFLKLFQGLSFFNKADYGSCIKVLAKIPSDGHSHPTALLLEARANLHLCNYANAMRLLGKISFLYPRLNQANEIRALASLELGNDSYLSHTLYSSIVNSAPSPLISVVSAICDFDAGNHAMAQRILYNLQKIRSQPLYSAWGNYCFVKAMLKTPEDHEYFRHKVFKETLEDSTQDETLSIFSRVESAADPNAVYKWFESKAQEIKNGSCLFYAIWGEFASRIGKHEKCLFLLSVATKALPSLRLFELCANARDQLGE